MALNVSAFSIRQPVPSLVVAAAILVLGWISFERLPIALMPNVDVPVISIVITEFGASPTDLETQVTKKVEDAVAGVEGVHHIESSISDGVSRNTVIFQLGVDTDRALNDVKDAVTRIRGDLPTSIDEPMIQRVDVAGLPILTYAAIAPGKTPDQLSWFVEDVVVRALQGVRGVASIQRIGSVEREIRVALDPVRLQAVGLTPLDVSRQLRSSSVDLAGGRAEIGGNDQIIRTLAAAKTLTDLAATRIALPTGGDVQLGDLGQVTDTIAEPRSFARFNGTPVVGFSILRSKGASDVVVAQAVADRIKEIEKDNPGIDLKLIDTSVPQTIENYHSALQSLYEGATLAVVVIFLFLRDIRTTLIAAVALPLSILPAFWVMDVFGFSLNKISLLAIILSTGILVDDAIVEIENIAQHIQMGKPPFQAALDAADEIGLAVIAISLTIVAVFLPASFMSSIPGQFFKQFGITVSVQVLFSLLCARLITPMLAAYLLRPLHHKESSDGLTMRVYSRLVTWSVRHRFITVAVTLIFFAATMAAAPLLPTGFLPVTDTSRSLLALELPPGAELAETETVTNAIVNRVRRLAEVESVFVDGGSIPNSNPEVRKASLTINYVPRADRSLSQKGLELKIGQALTDLPDIRYWFLDENGRRNVSLIVVGPKGNTVASAAAELGAQMRRLPSISNVVASATLDRPELRIYPRLDLAVRLGVSTEALAQTIRVSTIGDFEQALAKFDTGDQVVPIRVLLEESARADPQILEQIRVPSTHGGPGVPLNEVADIRFGEGPISIERYDRQRQATVEADLVGEAALGGALAAVRALPVMKNLPPGVSVIEAGDSELQKDLFEGFSTSMRNGLMMVYVVLAVLFASVLQPWTIMLSLPLSVSGAILALLLTKSAITTPVVIGILMLMGIVTKNAIMLVDFAKEAMHKGIERRIAVIQAGERRARPILMTTIAMTAGMLPSALGFGAGGEFRAPMATTIIGGLLVATFLSLLFVPALFTFMDDLGRLTWRVFGKVVGVSQKSDHPEAPVDQPSLQVEDPSSLAPQEERA